jgi:hypothetical protein
MGATATAISVLNSQSGTLRPDLVSLMEAAIFVTAHFEER